MLTKKEELELQIVELQNQLNELSKDDCIKKLSDYSVDEKIEFFDKIYSSAYNDLYADEYDDDNEHYMWEFCMGILAKDKREFWKYYNELR